MSMTNCFSSPLLIIAIYLFVYFFFSFRKGTAYPRESVQWQYIINMGLAVYKNSHHLN